MNGKDEGHTACAAAHGGDSGREAGPRGADLQPAREPELGRDRQRRGTGTATSGGCRTTPSTRTQFDLRSWFGREAPLIVEVGSGVGEATVALAAARPSYDVLAFEVWHPGVADTFHRLGRRA